MTVPLERCMVKNFFYIKKFAGILIFGLEPT